MKKLEEEKQQPTPPALPPQSQPTPPPELGTHLQPKGLNFSTPQSRSSKQIKAAMPSTPATASERISDVESLSSEATSVTPEMSKLNLGKRRGRPRKELVEPTMDDFPYGGTEAEQKAYIRKKNTEFWRYNKLTSSDSAAYRQSENEHVAKYNKRKKEKEQQDDEKSEDSDRQKELSRER